MDRFELRPQLVQGKRCYAAGLVSITSRTVSLVMCAWTSGSRNAAEGDRTAQGINTHSCTLLDREGVFFCDCQRFLGMVMDTAFQPYARKDHLQGIGIRPDPVHPKRRKMISKLYQLPRDGIALTVNCTLTLRRRTVSDVSSSVLALPLSPNARSGNPA
jgi:hypothetical protein